MARPLRIQYPNAFYHVTSRIMDKGSGLNIQQVVVANAGLIAM